MEHAATSPENQGAALEASEQRVAPRVTLLIRPAKLTTAEGEFVCVIRDVSSTGVSVRLFHPPPIGQRAQLETETGQIIEMERVWVRDQDAGFRFAEPIDIAALVNEEGRYPKRKLRLSIEMPVTVSVLGKESYAVVRNISQQGARIACDQRFAIEQIVRLKADHLREVRAKIRWRRDEEYGLIFEDTFSLGEFAQLAALLQSPSLLGH